MDKTPTASVFTRTATTVARASTFYTNKVVFFVLTDKPSFFVYVIILIAITIIIITGLSWLYQPETPHVKVYRTVMQYILMISSGISVRFPSIWDNFCNNVLEFSKYHIIIIIYHVLGPKSCCSPP